ncbi:hypothetical protein ACFVX6_17515 [Streptomyces sp. NPDC058289]|uniref:hypothetical protein n=1 Tax=Streptomyces sp. NPDC058289 TaxID=3346425 RepID=UPI0036E48F88
MAYNIIGLLGIVLFCLVGLGAGVVLFVRSLDARHAGSRPTWLLWRAVASLGMAFGFAMYLWGLLHVALLDETAQFEACMKAGGTENVARVDAFEGEYVPLRLMCRVDEGGSYGAAVPGYVNPAVVMLAFGTLVAGGVALAEHAELAKKAKRKGN